MRKSPIARRLITLLLLLPAAGCNKGGILPEPAPATVIADRQEYWDAAFMGDAKIGQAHTEVERLDRDGQRLVRTRVTQQLQLSRSGDVSRQTMEMTCVETAAGKLVEFTSSMNSGDAAIKTQGKVEGDKLRLTQIAGRQQDRSTLPWQDDWGGFFAMENSLRNSPMKPGESRSLQALYPGLNQLAELRLRAADEYAEERLLDGKTRLLRIDSEIVVGNVRLKQVQWCDPEGEVRKGFDPQVQLTTYRTTEERAMAESAATFAFEQSTFVKSDRPLLNPHEQQRVVYRVSLPDDDPAEVFVDGPSQSVRRVDDRTTEIEVRSIRPGRTVALAAATPEDLGPNTLIQSNDPRVVAMASSVARDETDPWKVAVALERLVHDKVQQKDYTRAFDSAAVVAETLQGDCTEHAVLLAALCRAREIPARVASGLVAYGEGFAYHMWTEVLIDSVWIPLDGTLGRGGIGAGHIKLTQSNLAGANSFAALLPVLQVIGRVKIDVVEQAP